MAIKASFHNELLEIPIKDLLPSKKFGPAIILGKKYSQILSSIREVGLIEPPAVAKTATAGKYLILDGHLRIKVLEELGEESVTCLLSTEDESYTYNKFVNRISPVQENKMLLEALANNVPEEKMARALGIQLNTLKAKLNLLSGICPEAVELLKDKPATEYVFVQLRKMNKDRQIAVASLMNDHNNYTQAYTRALLDTTSDSQLAEGYKRKKRNPKLIAKQAKLEEENKKLNKSMEEVKATYCDLMFDMTAVQGYLKRLLGHPEVAKYLEDLHPTYYARFSEILKTWVYVPEE